MAKKAKSSEQGENKSQAIRDYVKENPDAGPTAVAEALNASKGWEISAAYVSTIKNKMKETTGGRATRGAGGRSSTGGRRSAGGIDTQALIQAKELAKQAGGINQAKAALDLLAKLTN